MERFHIIEEGAVILRLKGGTFSQRKVYRRGRDVYAQHGSGFLKLHTNKGTSSPHVSWLDLEADGVTLDRPGAQPVYTAPLAQAAE